MLKRLGFFIPAGRGRSICIEYRRYAFGGVYLIIGHKWITLRKGR